MNIRRRVPELSNPYPDLPKLEGDIFLIFAHADDELGVAGAVSVMAPMARVHWIVVTDSAAGFVSPLYRKGRSKGDCRWTEAHQCAKVLGLPAPMCMALPDGHLQGVADLAERIGTIVDQQRQGSVGAIFTHDVCGLYGHSDHLAVYDAIRHQFAGSGIPLVAQALPRYFHRWLPLRRPARQRRRAAITHKFDMDRACQVRKALATRAHRSQRHVFLAMMQGRTPEHFFRVFSREFFSVETL